VEFTTTEYRIVEIYFAEFLSKSGEIIDSIFKIAFLVLGKSGRLLDQFLTNLKSQVDPIRNHLYQTSRHSGRKYAMYGAINLSTTWSEVGLP
jgi:hypothetical protein